MDFLPFFISFKLAFITTLILFFFCTPLAWYLSNTKSKIKPILEALVSLPIVLPPSVIGFYFLIFLSHNSPIGAWFESVFDVRLVFSFTGITIASCFYSLPFMVQPLQSGFESLNKNMIEASLVAGKSKFTTLVKIAIPNIKPSILTAIIITFAHTIGEFGVVLMVGGNISGQTKVASVAIYELVEILEYDKAHVYSALMLIMSFAILLLVYTYKARKSK